MANALPPQTAHADAAAPKGALDPNEFRAFKLMEKKQLTGNTYLYRCAGSRFRGLQGQLVCRMALSGQGLRRVACSWMPGHYLLSTCMYGVVLEAGCRVSWMRCGK